MYGELSGDPRTSGCMRRMQGEQVMILLYHPSHFLTGFRSPLSTMRHQTEQKIKRNQVVTVSSELSTSCRRTLEHNYPRTAN